MSTQRYVTFNITLPSCIELRATVSQALSATDQLVLQKLIESALSEYSDDERDHAIYVRVDNMSCNGLWIFAIYADPSKLTETLSDIALSVRNKVETWLLRNNLIAPLPQVVNIVESKAVVGKFKEEKATEKGVLHAYHTYDFVITTSPFNIIALGDNKNAMGGYIKARLLETYPHFHGDPDEITRVLWFADDDKAYISASIRTDCFGLSNVVMSQKFLDETVSYLTQRVNVLQGYRKTRYMPLK